MSFIIPSGTPPEITIVLTTARDGLDFSRSPENNHAAAYGVVKNKFGVDVITLKQMHSALIREVSLQTAAQVQDSVADGLFTTETGIAIGILTADCYPVFLVGERGVCALHCGWRGTVSGIVNKSAAFFDKVGDMPKYAYIGYGISNGEFIVQQDFIGRLSEKDLAYLSQMSTDCGEARYNFDLLGKICADISALGVQNIVSLGRCTVKDTNFYSHRRDKTQKRMLSFIFKGKSL
ncbi:MAG: polyphenol oxidase family protein [Deferribacteraceae bacterium]|jgi:YfiH family protein|nr:polyphenol oxidase family protein [Deferribacteraceae bacterium]